MDFEDFIKVQSSRDIFSGRGDTEREMDEIDIEWGRRLAKFSMYKRVFDSFNSSKLKETNTPYK